MSRIIGMMRVKNEARWIERVLRSMLPVCGKILLFDDHSTDGTPEFAETIPGVVVIRSPFAGLSETRDKNYLLEQVGAFGPEARPDWILAIDGDEEIAPGGAEQIQEICARDGGPDCYSFRVRYLWDRPDQVRVDRWYADFRRPSLFRFWPAERFHSAAGGGFHCGNVPSARMVGACGVDLLHYGYLYREDRVRKYQWYNAPDKQPIPAVEDGYRHMVVGDLFPADSRFRWAGPLELRAL